jgi:hypothetical protein
MRARFPLEGRRSPGPDARGRRADSAPEKFATQFIPTASTARRTAPRCRYFYVIHRSLVIQRLPHACRAAQRSIAGRPRFASRAAGATRRPSAMALVDVAAFIAKAEALTPKDAGRAVRAALRSAEPAARAALAAALASGAGLAGRALLALGPPDAATALALLGDGSAIVRMRAARSLRAFVGRSTSEVELAAALRAAPDSETRRAVARVLTRRRCNMRFLGATFVGMAGDAEGVAALLP